MKQFYLRITCLLLFIFSIGSITAQTCSSIFTVSTTSTPSTCQANGTITVTLNGDLTNLTNVQYGLTTSAGAAVINPQENNVLTNIPAGSYTVTVRAFCKVDENYNVVKTVANVVVGGNYKVPSASFNAGSSRKSYSTCNTGIIALNVTDGSGTFTFNITSAPAGVTLGEVVPTKSGTLYTFPTQDYPAGNYSVQIQDGCYTSVATFTLGQITGFPPTGISTTSFYPTLIDGDCSSLKVYPGTVSNSDPDFYRYYTDGMYEIGITKAGAAMPTNWYSWKPGSASPYVLDLSPYSLSDFYASNSMVVYLRVKGCPNSYTTSLTNLRQPYATTSYTRRCDDYLFSYRPWTDYDGNLCYPLSVVITQTTNPGAGTVIYTGSIPAASASSYSSIALQYGVGYNVAITDAAGKALSPLAPNTSRSNMSLSYSDVPCSTTYNLTYSSYEPCYPIDVTITEVATGTVIYTNRLTSTSSATTALEYGKSYRFDAVYVGTDPLRSYTYTIPIRNANQPTAYTMSINSPNSCIEDYGQLYIYSTGGINFPAGTTMTVTGPAGYTTQTYTATSQSYYYYFPATTLPAGTYTLTVNSTCPGALPITTVVNLPGAYSGRNLAYTTQNTCEGTKVFPTGTMTYQGNNTTTYYRLTNGPAGYDQTVIGPGGSFTLSTPGTYTLGILNTNSATGCVINTKTIVYTAPPLALDNTGTSAYTCVDDVTGIIIVKGTNGVAPYTYQLWDEANTTKLVATDLVSSDRAIFNYGDAGATYTVRVKDQCGNEFSQKVTLARLKTARIVNADPSSICTGETIVLKCTTLGTTAYTWTGPNGYTSTAQNPTIPNATANMTGWYKVSVMPEFCGEAVKDSAYVTVYAPLTAGTVALPQAVCVRTPANALTGAITGGSGNYTYQWQTSLDGSTGWTDISGATAANYTPPVKIQSGANYYRVVVTDRCGTVNGNPITVNSTPCYLPVNPNIRSRGER